MSAKAFPKGRAALACAAALAVSCSARDGGAGPSSAGALEIRAPEQAAVFGTCELEVTLPPEFRAIPDTQVHDAHDADRDGRFARLEAEFRHDSGGALTVPGFAMRAEPGGEWLWRVRWSPRRAGEWRVRVRFEGRISPDAEVVRVETELARAIRARLDPVLADNGPLVAPGDGETPRYLRRLGPDGSTVAAPLFGACRAWVAGAPGKPDPAGGQWAAHEWLDRERELLAPMREAGYDLLNQWMAPWELLLVHRDRAELWRGAEGAWRREAVGDERAWSSYQSVDQGRALAFDEVVRQCEGDPAKGEPTVRLLLSPLPHQCLQLAAHPWGANESGWSPEDDPHGQSLARLNGFSGFRENMTVWEFFEADPARPMDDWRSRLFDHQANFWRYCVARWGASRAVGAWVIADELDAVGDVVGLVSERTGWWAHPQCDRWLADTFRLFRGELRRSDGFRYQGDPWRHPLHAATTSYGGGMGPESNIMWRGAVASGGELVRPDLFGWHWYPYWRGRATYADVWKIVIAGVAAYAAAPVGEAPRLVSEFGSPDRSAPEDAPSRLYPTLYHHAIWAATFAGLAGTPMDWDDGKEFGELTWRERRGAFDRERYPLDNAAEMRALKRFLEGVDFEALAPCAGEGATVKCASVGVETAPHPGERGDVPGGPTVFALHARDRSAVYGWAWSPTGHGAIAVSGLAAGEHLLTWFDPWEGAPLAGLEPVTLMAEEGKPLVVMSARAFHCLEATREGFPAESRRDRGHDVAFRLVRVPAPEAAEEPVPVHGLFERGVSTGALGIGPAENPFDPDEVAVDVIVARPDGSRAWQPCFWFVPMEPYYVKFLSEDGSRATEWERFRATGAGEWRFRLSPHAPGEYRYEYKVSMKGRSRTQPGGSFTAQAREGGHPGPVVVRGGERGFRHADGRPFVPTGMNLGWPEESGSRIYSEWLRRMGDAGANSARLWLVHYMCGTALEWSMKSVNPGYAGVGRYSQESAARVDRILAAAREAGVRVMLSFFSFGDTNWDWKSNPYSKPGGGWLSEPAEFFTDARARAAVRKRLRYAVARYGWSPNVWAWELWNEVETSRGFAAAPVAEWHEEMAEYLKAIDVHCHPVTTSYRFAPPTTGCRAYALDSVDFVNAHTYLPELARVFGARMNALRGFGKPVVISEFGLGVRPDYFDADPAGLHVHDGLWAGVLSGSAGAGMTWWWERYVHPRDLHFHFTGIARFVESVCDAGTDLAGAEVLECRVTGGGTPCFALAVRAGDGILAWVGTAREVRRADGDPRGRVTSYSAPASGGPFEVRIKGRFGDGLEAVVWDTFDGAPVGTAKVSRERSAATVAVPRFRHDVALRIAPAGKLRRPARAGAATPVHDRFERLLPGAAH